MKVIHIITGLEVGGAERFLSRLLGPLSAKYDCEVISLTTRGPMAEEIERHGVPIRVLGMTRSKIQPSKLLKLAGWLRESRPDVVHTWLYHADLIGGLAARLAGVPTLMWNIRLSKLSTDYLKRSVILVARICAAISRFVPDVIVCCAQTAKDEHAAFGYDERKMVVIHNGIDLDRFKPDPAARAAFRDSIGASPDTTVIGMVGRFDRQKNYRGFFELAARLRKTRPEAVFVAIGHGVDEENLELRSWRQELGLTTGVHVLGRRMDLERIMPGLDLLVSPSQDEGFPNAVAEAMAIEVPCVVTDVGDSRMLVDDTGITVPPGDAEALYQAVEAVLSESQTDRQARGARARRRIAEHFGLQAAADQYAGLYDAWIARTRARRARSNPAADQPVGEPAKGAG